MKQNILIPEHPDLSGIRCPVVEDPKRVADGYAQYLADESRLQGTIPQRVYFPTTTQEAAAALVDIHARGETVTVSGARTGIVGGAVNVDAPNLVSLERITFRPRVRFDETNDCWSVCAGAGMPLQALLESLRSRSYEVVGEPPAKLFYPVDPTETSASLGGNVATNASGARTLYYGPTRDWVLGLTVVLADGSILRIERGQCRARDGRFTVRSRGSEIEVCIPAVPMPQTKNVAGYYLAPDMDLIDLFIGNEGTLGVITEMRLRLCEMPKERLFLCVFLPSDDCSVPLVRAAKRASALRPFALEYMDANSLSLLRGFREEQGAASGVPQVPDGTAAALYMEIDLSCSDSDSGSAAYEATRVLLEEHGVPLDASWAGTGRHDLEAMKKFRHALPERVNGIIGRRRADIPGLTKVGTDMAVPDDALGEMMTVYRETLDAAGLEYVIFGHIGDGHVHVNILPRTLEELKAAKDMYGAFAARAVALGGSVAGEHGIGRIKKHFLRVQYGEQHIRDMQAIKKAFDPKGALNPGVLF